MVQDIVSLTDRERLILQAIVQLYILKAAPIGSRHLSKILEQELKLSAATIRNVMADLEEMQLISHPHTSAGRIPTDKGYRFYVDSLMTNDRLTAIEAKAVRDSLPQGSAETMLKDASKVLGMISRYLGIVEFPHIKELIIEKIELIPLSSERLLVVVALDSNIVRTVTIEARFALDMRALEALSALINDRISGRSLSFVRENFGAMFVDTDLAQNPLVRVFVDSVDRLFESSSVSERLHLAGGHNLLEYPEFEEKRSAKGVIELIENDEMIIHILDRMEGSSDVKVLIGSEINNELLNDYSLVVTNYFIGSAKGSIGLIGPKRMNYSKMFSLVQYVSSIISETGK